MNKKTLTVLGLAMMLGLSSCHADLDRMPTNITTAEKVYSTPEGVKQSLAKVYGTYAIPNGDVQGRMKTLQTLYVASITFKSSPQMRLFVLGTIMVSVISITFLGLVLILM